MRATLRELRNLIAADLRAWQRRGFLGPDRVETPLGARDVLGLLWGFAGVRATVVFRLSHAAVQLRLPLVPGWLARRNIRRYGLDIVPMVHIGPGLYIPHPVGTVVMAERIGSNCALISGVTLGMRTTLEFPRLGDDVTVGAGARILGDVTVGDGASIGANAVVLADVPAGMTAVGIPARLVPARVAAARDLVAR